MRVLFIDDEPESVAPARKHFNGLGVEFLCQVNGFTDVHLAIDKFAPDIVILDLLDGGASAEPEQAGKQTYELIWNTRFCPLIIYSAHPDLLIVDHPFVKKVQKGANSPSLLEKATNDLKVQVNALSAAERHFRRHFADAMRDVAPLAFKTFTDPTARDNAIVRSGRRRLAALMDDMARHGESLAGWEQYLCPPVGGDLLLGDILHESGKPSEDACAFHLVLSPSCDMASSHGRKAKIPAALVARCCSMESGLKLTSIGNMGTSKLRERLSSTVLTHGHFESIVPLPAYGNLIPHMTANLRDLMLLPLDSIGTDKAHCRVASIDSPFRELVSWAYMQVACRPGIPDRDTKQWCEDILSGFPAPNADRKL